MPALPRRQPNHKQKSFAPWSFIFSVSVLLGRLAISRQQVLERAHMVGTCDSDMIASTGTDARQRDRES
jgi:hypothetical protein